MYVHSNVLLYKWNTADIGGLLTNPLRMAQDRTDQHKLTMLKVNRAQPREHNGLISGRIRSFNY